MKIMVEMINAVVNIMNFFLKNLLLSLKIKRVVALF